MKFRHLGIFATAALLASAAFADDIVLGVQAYMVENGLDPAMLNRRGSPAQLVTRGGEEQIKWIRHKLRNVPAPDLGNLLPPEEAQAVIYGAKADADASRQAAKPLDQKMLENDYFDLVSTLLTEDNDQRATNAVMPTLTFKQMADKVKKIKGAKKQDFDNYEAMFELLVIDAALKEYDPKWIDKAQRHDLGD